MNDRPRPRRIGIWAVALGLSVLGSNFAWPLFGAVGLPELGWFVSLLLWLVAAPTAGILLIASLWLIPPRVR